MTDIEQRAREQSDGMSLRDYFAGQALAGIGTWMPNTPGMVGLSDRVAINARSEWAYRQADAMLKSGRRVMHDLTHEHPCTACAELQAENLEQARLLGKSAEREAALKGEIKRLKQEVAQLSNPTWFYADGREEQCMWSPDEVIDYCEPTGDCVIEVACGRSLPSIWCAVKVTADEDADELYSFTEHASEADARTALEGLNP